MTESEKLFLLEFLVDSVYVHKQCGKEISTKDWMSGGQTCVTFQFMQFPSLEILETDFPRTQCPGNKPQKFESGKSCLFALPERLIRNAPGEFIVNVAISKKQPLGCLPDTIEVGQAKVDITNEFTSVISEIFRKPNDIPASKSLKDRFVIHSHDGHEPVGQIHLFVRLSCFGKLIITQFTLASGKSYLFKGNEDSLYKCQQVDSKKEASPCAQLNAALGSGICPGPKPSGVSMGGMDNRSSNKGRNSRSNPQYIGTESRVTSQTMDCRMPSGCPPRPCPGAAGERYPVPQEAPLMTIPKPRQVQRMTIDCSGVSPKASDEDCPSQEAPTCPPQQVPPCPASPGKDGGIFVEIPDQTSKQCQNVACFKITKGPNEYQTQMPSCHIPPPLPNKGLVEDSFVLRIGKRCTKGCSEKEQLELELRAPPQRYKETKECQWDDADSAAAAAAAK